VNTVLVSHHWDLAEYISRKIASAEWCDGFVEDLADDHQEALVQARARATDPAGRRPPRGAHQEESLTAVRQIPASIDEFKNAYNVEFLGLAAKNARGFVSKVLGR
jgi:hypothetical protein